MAKITIFEKDVTSPGITSVTNNVVFIPGYSIMGPVNSPILCQTLESFQKIFGSKPYKFESIQANPTFNPALSGKYANINDYEKSYVYAAELLRNGLPVMFERVMKEDIIDTFTASNVGTTNASILSIKSKNPGQYGTYIEYKCTKIPVEAPAVITDFVFEVRLQRDNEFGIPETINTSYVISNDPTSKNFWENINTLLVDLSISEDADISTLVNNTEFVKLSIPTPSPLSHEFSVSNFYNILKGYSYTSGELTINVDSIFNKLIDRNDFNIKFISSGTYPVFEYDSNSVTDIMLTIAAKRGDTSALIDHTNIIDRPLIGLNSLHESVNNLDTVTVVTGENVDTEEDARKYGSMMTPWASYSSRVINKNIILPGSFAYLNALAISIRTNANWYAIAGVTRGLVPNIIEPCQKVTGAIATALQARTGISINPILFINPYGYCLWGNRTLHENEIDLAASSFLNVRCLTNDVKKVIYTSARSLTFELNDDILWLNFKSTVEKTLDQMVSGNGLTGYKVIRKSTTKKATIVAIIKLFTVEAVEDFDITVELADSYIEVQ